MDKKGSDSMETKKKVIPIIAMDHISKQYSTGVEALHDISIRINKGEFVFVVGKSGSGKSTFIKLLLKELDPTEGRLFVGGRQVTHLKRKRVSLYRRKIGVVFQDFRLLKNKTVYALGDEDFIYSKANISLCANKVIQISGVYTKKEFRRKGYASFLVNRIAFVAGKVGCKATLLVRQENLAAYSAYKKAGFGITGTYKIVYYK